jgi:hypothetical protein
MTAGGTSRGQYCREGCLCFCNHLTHQSVLTAIYSSHGSARTQKPTSAEWVPFL